MIKVVTYGTFDLFHYGHLRLLERARNLGDYLMVGVSTDEFNSLKGKKCIHPFRQRVQIVEAIKYVDKVFPENEWAQKQQDIITNKIDIFVIGDDWQGKFDELEKWCDVKYLKRTPDISSTAIKNILKK